MCEKRSGLKLSAQCRRYHLPASVSCDIQQTLAPAGHPMRADDEYPPERRDTNGDLLLQGLLPGEYPTTGRFHGNNGMYLYADLPAIRIVGREDVAFPRIQSFYTADETGKPDRFAPADGRRTWGISMVEGLLGPVPAISGFLPGYVGRDDIHPQYVYRRELESAIQPTI